MNFRLNYDDNGFDIIEKISGKLAEFDLIIKNVDEGDGWIDYNIQKIEKIENENIELKNVFLTDVSQFYPDNIKNEIIRLNKNHVIYGEIEPPIYFNISLENVSHLIKNLSFNDGKIYGDVTILNTNKGKILKNVIKQLNNYEILFKMRYDIYSENNYIKIFTWDIVK